MLGSQTHLRTVQISMLLPLLAGLCCCAATFKTHAAEIREIEILYIEQQIERPPVLSNLVSWPEDEGEQGAELGITDNNTTGKFLKQNYSLSKLILTPSDDLAAQAAQILHGGPKLVVLNVSASALLTISRLPEAKDDLFFNSGSPDTELRQENCIPNLLHTLPSRAMLADALMQFFSKKRWRKLFLLEGNRPGDVAFAQAIRHAAKKFGLDIKYDKKWIEDADLRRSASAEIPALTQGKSYDAVVVTDEDHDFGQYVMYNTWLPRPVTGSAGIEPLAWHAAVEQWGAIQLQSRFNEQADRSMNSVDYAAWAAVRTIGEAVTRTESTEASVLKRYIFSDEFSLAAFKGAKMTYRKWNGQLRQPIPLVHPRAVVALAPLEGFIHQYNELDTLGLDESESSCNTAASQ